MIKIEKLGGLGNAMFQFAFGYAAAKQLGTLFYMSEMSWFHFFENRSYWRARNKFISALDKSISRREKEKFDFRGNIVDPADRLSSIKNDVIYKGYFQSEKYFLNVSEEIRKIFRIRKQSAQRFCSQNQNFDTRKKLMIHVRGGDYKALDVFLPDQYYQTAYEEACKAGMADHDVYVITNDLPYAQRVLSGIKYQLVGGEMEIDFQWMLAANALIIPNSTFSWWGAWLNNNKPTVFVPNYWSGANHKQENPHSIIPERWNRV